MASIGDIMFRLGLEGTQLEIDARKQGARAGDAAGTAMSIGIKAKLSDVFKGGVFAGAGLEIGRQALLGLEAGISNVIDAIPNLIHQGQEFALLVDDISDKTGSAAENSSRFAATLQYLGIPTAGLGLQLKTLSGDIINSEDKLNKLGIATRDSNGNLLDTITVLDNVRSYLSGATDGAAKMTLATDLLGRGAGALTDYLNLTDEQAAALNKTFDETGQTINETTRKAAESLTRETNLLSGAFQGFANQLFTEVAPTIRAVIAGITDFIKTHGAEIRETLISMTQAVLGFVEGLLGVAGMTPFQTTLDGLGNSAANVTLSFDQWAQQTGHTIPAQDKLKTSTKGATDAIDRQIASTQRAIDVEKRRDDAEETIFQRTMKRLAGEYGARLDALDLAEKQLATADRQRGLNEQLNQAQLDLGAAQKGPDAQAISNAMAKVADIQAQQAENERQLTRDTLRDRLEATKAYIEDVARLEAESANKPALVKNLKTREQSLQGQLDVASTAKDAAAIEDITAKLEAVKTAEERTAAAERSGIKTDELTTLKTTLDEQRKAIAAAGSGEVSDNKRKLGDLRAQYQTYLNEQKILTMEHAKGLEVIFGGDPSKGTGLGGSMTKAFTDGQAAGEKFHKFIVEELAPAVGKVVDFMVEVVGFFGDLVKDIQGLEDILNRINQLTGGAPDEQRFGKLLKGGGVLPGRDPSQPGSGDQTLGDLGKKPSDPGRGGGGPVTRGMPYIVGEHRPEVFVPGETGTIVPSLGGMAGMMGGGSLTVEVPVILDGDVLTRVVARRLADEYHR